MIHVDIIPETPPMKKLTKVLLAAAGSIVFELKCKCNKIIDFTNVYF
jgi:hypothetical protein